MELPRRQFLRLAAASAAAPALSSIAWAQAYPSRPVRIIHGSLPGGPVDILAPLAGIIDIATVVPGQTADADRELIRDQGNVDGGAQSPTQTALIDLADVRLDAAKKFGWRRVGSHIFQQASKAARAVEGPLRPPQHLDALQITWDEGANSKLSSDSIRAQYHAQAEKQGWRTQIAWYQVVTQ